LRALAALVTAAKAEGSIIVDGPPVDVIVSGSDTPLLTFLPSGWLDRVEPVLVAPDVLNPKVWKDGHLWYADPCSRKPSERRVCVPTLSKTGCRATNSPGRG
jgi:hypothetical protein